MSQNQHSWLISFLRSPMRTVTFRTALAHKMRMALALIAIVLGTSFISGSLVLTASMQKSLDTLLDAGTAGVDVGLAGSAQNTDGIPFSIIEKLKTWPEIRAINITGDGTGTPSGTMQAGRSSIIITDPTGRPVQAGSSGAHPLAAYPAEEKVGPPLVAVAGSFPANENEVMVNHSAAQRAGINVGNIVTVVTPQQRLSVKVTGLFTTATDTAGWIGVAFTPEQYLQLFTDGKHASQAVIARQTTGEHAISADQLRAKIGRTFPGYTVLTAAQIEDKLIEAQGTNLDYFRYVMITFGVIAMVVGSFIIYNTFTMMMNRRRGEFALLRAIGVPSSQIRFSVMMEATTAAVVGTVIGVLIGLGAVKLLTSVLTNLSAGLGVSQIVFDPSSIIIPLAIGILVTICSAIYPAYKCSPKYPMETLRTARGATSSSVPKGTKAYRLMTALRLALAGVLFFGGLGAQAFGAIVSNLNGQDMQLGLRLAFVGAGAVTVLIAMIIIGEYGIRVITKLFTPIGKLQGKLGMIGLHNITRNSGRSAATALAFCISIALMCCISVIGNTAKATINGITTDMVTSDFVLDSIGAETYGQFSTSASLAIPAGVDDTIANLPGVKEAVTYLHVPLKLRSWDKQDASVALGDLNDVLDLQVIKGSTADWDQPGVYIHEDYANSVGLKLGDLVPLRPFGASDDVEPLIVPIKAIYGNNNYVSSFIVNYAAAASVVTDANTYARQQIFVKVEDNSKLGLKAMRSRLESAVAPYLVVQVKTRNEFSGPLGTQLEQTIRFVYGMLSLAVLIALLGIMNTLFLNVSERTREIATLRAIGFQKRQVKRMLRSEATLLAIDGLLVGVLFGTGVGVAICKTLGTEGFHTPVVPWKSYLLLALATVIVGQITAILPARRAANLPPVAAIKED